MLGQCQHKILTFTKNDLTLTEIYAIALNFGADQMWELYRSTSKVLGNIRRPTVISINITGEGSSPAAAMWSPPKESEVAGASQQQQQQEGSGQEQSEVGEEDDGEEEGDDEEEEGEQEGSQEVPAVQQQLEELLVAMQVGSSYQYS